jgi:hypothetical protein
MKRNALFFRSHRVVTFLLLLFLCSRRFSSSVRVVIKSGLNVLLRVKWRHVWYGVETQSVLHLKALSFTKEDVSLTHTLSLSLYEEREKKAKVFFIHRRELSSHTEKAIEKCKRAKREHWNWKLPARGNKSLKSKSS